MASSLLHLAPYVPTPMKVENRVLDLTEVKKGDVVYDLGSGDGIIVITAAKKYGARAVEFEIDHKLVQKSRASVKREGVEHLVEIRLCFTLTGLRWTQILPSIMDKQKKQG